MKESKDNCRAKLDAVIASIDGATRLSPLKLNEMRFSGKRTVITERRLRNASGK